MQPKGLQAAARQCSEGCTAQIIELGNISLNPNICETAPAPRPRLLPAYDARTDRLELGAFFLLGATSIALILLAAGNARPLSQNLVNAAPPNGTVLATSLGAANTNHALTNLTLSPGTPVGANQPPPS